MSPSRSSASNSSSCGLTFFSAIRVSLNKPAASKSASVMVTVDGLRTVIEISVACMLLGLSALIIFGVMLAVVVGALGLFVYRELRDDLDATINQGLQNQSGDLAELKREIHKKAAAQ